MAISVKILIMAPCFNRKAITKIVLEQLMANKGPEQHLIAINDGSTDYDSDFLSPLVDEVITNNTTQGIDAVRMSNFKLFMERDYEYLYLTDNDAFHAPDYLDRLLYLRNKTSYPSSIFNSPYHEHNTKRTYGNDYVVRSSCPGVSILLKKPEVRAIIQKNAQGFDSVGWDYNINKAIPQYAISFNSYIYHFENRDSTIKSTVMTRDLTMSNIYSRIKIEY